MPNMAYGHSEEVAAALRAREMSGVERVAATRKDRAVCTQRSRPFADCIRKGGGLLPVKRHRGKPGHTRDTLLPVQLYPLSF